ncbi:hypothetical protein R1flu_027640 [Riccia fluitans]|uniref:Uncharacterized protein n=1 Tax=Riccia fluitans TaxID=41844 RepID=A0ABD1XJD3_9MARC
MKESVLAGGFVSSTYQDSPRTTARMELDSTLLSGEDPRRDGLYGNREMVEAEQYRDYASLCALSSTGVEGKESPLYCQEKTVRVGQGFNLSDCPNVVQESYLYWEILCRLAQPG